MILVPSSEWQRTPDAGEAAWGTEATVRRVRICGRDPVKDAYGCVDWFDFEPCRRDALVQLDVLAPMEPRGRDATPP
jgi:hypothetical protein